MSVGAMTWAFKLELRPATVKFVLLALADNADDEGRAFPSIETLARKTSLDRKTVIGALDQLEHAGLLSDTGKRVGRTGSVKVYRIAYSNSTESGTSTENGTAKQYRNSQEAVPFFPGSSTENGTQNHQGNHKGTDRARETRSARATRIPEDFSLTPEREAYARKQKIEPRREFEKFCAHFKAASGTVARKCDWDAAWQKWCLTAVDRGAQTEKPSNGLQFFN